MIAQDQDQLVFQKSSRGRSLDTTGSNRALERDQFLVRRTRIMLSEGMMLTGRADREVATCPPSHSHQLISGTPMYGGTI
jgi:hypothetical protein